MKKRKLKNGLGLVLILSALAYSCAWHNEEDLYPISSCDTTNVTYAKTITPVLSTNCYNCHASSVASGGVILDTYSGTDTVVKNGHLWGALNHEQGYYPMPLNANKLGNCELSKISIWIRNGAPDN